MIQELNRRYNAAARMEPLACGKRDPDFFAPQRRPKSPEVTMCALSIGGTVTRAEALAAWHAFPDARDFIATAVTPQAAGWRAA